jgi:hypothetical protein
MYNKSDLIITNHSPFSIEPLKGKYPQFTQDRGCTVLKALNIKYWVTSGNLLGMYRDNKFIEHDTDIDVAVHFDWEESSKYDNAVNLIQLMNKNGFQLVLSVVLKNRPMQLAFVDKLNQNIIFDIYFYYTGLEKGYGLNYNMEGFIKKPEKFLHLGSFSWNGMKYPIPGHIKEFMEWRFGKSWKTPTKKKVPWQEEAKHLIRWQN